ncbi:hypothetical protein FRX31_029452 [Thalictrum thalictroides]|uniref:Reverse transcriptase zinc-binding domain-containing protein n=1 Tax=Thalictrum thalictroides TaxID=46969 RepID=A0A7J6V7F8_THATH|nr:hypothetical protein FRX31_029452 [Thalictrum thalictroides]
MYGFLLKKNRDYIPWIDPEVVWRTHIPMNVKFFFSSFVWERLLTVDNLIARGIDMPNSCVLCNNHGESMKHLFFQCPTSLLVWNSLLSHLGMMDEIMDNNGAGDFLCKWPSLNNRGLSAAIWDIIPYTVIWILWRTRNTIVFDNGVFALDEVVRRIKCTLWNWLDIIGKEVDVKENKGIAVLFDDWEEVVRDNW